MVNNHSTFGVEVKSAYIPPFQTQTPPLYGTYLVCLVWVGLLSTMIVLIDALSFLARGLHGTNRFTLWVEVRSGLGSVWCIQWHGPLLLSSVIVKKIRVVKGVIVLFCWVQPYILSNYNKNASFSC